MLTRKLGGRLLAFLLDLLNSGLNDASVKICNTKTTSSFSFVSLSPLSVNCNVLSIKIVIYKNGYELNMYSGLAQINIVIVTGKDHVTLKSEVMAM